MKKEQLDLSGGGGTIKVYSPHKRSQKAKISNNLGGSASQQNLSIPSKVITEFSVESDPGLLKRSEQMFNQKSAAQKMKIFSEMEQFMISNKQTIGPDKEEPKVIEEEQSMVSPVRNSRVSEVSKIQSNKVCKQDPYGAKNLRPDHDPFEMLKESNVKAEVASNISFLSDSDALAHDISKQISNEAHEQVMRQKDRAGDDVSSRDASGGGRRSRAGRKTREELKKDTSIYSKVSASQTKSQDLIPTAKSKEIKDIKVEALQRSRGKSKEGFRRGQSGDRAAANRQSKIAQAMSNIEMHPTSARAEKARKSTERQQTFNPNTPKTTKGPSPKTAAFGQAASSSGSRNDQADLEKSFSQQLVTQIQNASTETIKQLLSQINYGDPTALLKQIEEHKKNPKQSNHDQMVKALVTHLQKQQTGGAPGKPALSGGQVEKPKSVTRTHTPNVHAQKNEMIFRGSFQNKNKKGLVAAVNEQVAKLSATAGQQQPQPTGKKMEKKGADLSNHPKVEHSASNFKASVPQLDMSSVLDKSVNHQQPLNLGHLQKAANQPDISVLNQYETAVQLLNQEIQKLMFRNEQLVKENTVLKQQNEKFQAQGQMQNALMNMNPGSGQTDVNATDFNGNTLLWYNAQLKEAKSQLQDLRHQNQNLHIEIRQINDKRAVEMKEVPQLKDKLTEQLQANRSLTLNIETVNQELKKLMNAKTGLDQLLEQGDHQNRILKQELDRAEQQKATLFSHIQKVESNNQKLKDSFSKVVGRLRVMSEEFNREAIMTGADVNEYEHLIHEIQSFNLDQQLIELPPCSIETTLFKPFQFGGAPQASATSQMNMMNPAGAMSMGGFQGQNLGGGIQGGGGGENKILTQLMQALVQQQQQQQAAPHPAGQMFPPPQSSDRLNHSVMLQQQSMRDQMFASKLNQTMDQGQRVAWPSHSQQQPMNQNQSYISQAKGPSAPHAPASNMSVMAGQSSTSRLAGNQGNFGQQSEAQNTMNNSMRTDYNTNAKKGSGGGGIQWLSQSHNAQAVQNAYDPSGVNAGGANFKSTPPKVGKSPKNGLVVIN